MLSPTLKISTPLTARGAHAVPGGALLAGADAFPGASALASPRTVNLLAAGGVTSAEVSDLAFAVSRFHRHRLRLRPQLHPQLHPRHPPRSVARTSVIDDSSVGGTAVWRLPTAADSSTSAQLSPAAVARSSARRSKFRAGLKSQARPSASYASSGFWRMRPLEKIARGQLMDV